MKFLSDEFSNISPRRRPVFFWSKTTAPDEPVDVAAHPAALPPAAPAVTSHCCFYCQTCGSPILLPHDQMGLPFAQPSLRRIEVRTIATVCTSCNHISNHSLFRGCPGYDTRNKLMPAPTSGRTVLALWLQCDGSDCPFRVPLFVNLDSDLSNESYAGLVANWIWDDLTCIAGHNLRRAASTPRHHAEIDAV
jgi:hypothetical protein